MRAYASGLKKENVLFYLFILGSSDFNSNHINTKISGYSNGIWFRYLGNSLQRPNQLIIRNFRKIFASLHACWVLMIKGKKFDAIHIYHPSKIAYFPIYLYAKIARIPLVVEITELEHSRVPSNWKESVVQFFSKFHDFVVPYFATHLIVISNKLLEYYEKRVGKNKVTLIPIVVDLHRFGHIHMNGHNHRRIGYLGSFGRKDGVEGIIKAFAEANRENQGLKLRLIGYNPRKKHFDRVLKESGLNGEVEHTGQVKYDEIPHLLSDCDLLVVNRTNEPYSHFGFPTKLGEYLATGIPTISSRVGDVESYLTNLENSILIDPDNITDLRQAILHRYQGNFDYHTLGEKGRETCTAHFDYKKHTSRLAEIYRSLLKP